VSICAREVKLELPVEEFGSIVEMTLASWRVIVDGASVKLPSRRRVQVVMS
jgi:hypothetical protein